ncbi:MAG: AAA family ATPase [Pseudomonadota bacterium]
MPSLTGNTEESTPWAGLDRRANFFEDDAIRDLVARAVDYATAGVCLHLSGTAGLGKTTLALRIAQEMGRPVAFMAGNEWLTSRDFVGSEVGSTATTVVDKYVQSVHRTERQTRADWRFSMLAHAMEQGNTLVYDEFTRATPEANATLLSVLEEGVLISTDPASPQDTILAHPEFRIILTSNPHDYVGVNSAPDAFLDRVLTLRMEEPGIDTISGIIALRTGLPTAESQRIARVVSAVRTSAPNAQFSTLRSALLSARIAAPRCASGALPDTDLAQILTDVLTGRGVADAAHHIDRALESGSGKSKAKAA